MYRVSNEFRTGFKISYLFQISTNIHAVCLKLKPMRLNKKVMSRSFHKIDYPHEIKGVLKYWKNRDFRCNVTSEVSSRNVPYFLRFYVSKTLQGIGDPFFIEYLQVLNYFSIKFFLSQTSIFKNCWSVLLCLTAVFKMQAITFNT